MDALQVITEYLGEGVMESPSKWRFTCPACKSYGTLHVNPKKSGGPYICTACGLTGNAVTIAKNIGKFVSIPKDTSNTIDWSLIYSIYSKALEISTIRSSHVEWLNSRGIRVNDSNLPSTDGMIVRSSDMLISKLRYHFTEEELAKAGLMVTKEGKYYEAGVLGPNRIVIPYFSADGKCIYLRSRFAGKAVDPRHRFLSPTGVSGRKFSWGWETYNPDARYTIVTEGEIKAQAAKQMGFQCIGLPGMQTGHTFFAEECVRQGVESVYIVFDTESGTTSTGISKQWGVDSCANKLATELLSKSVKVWRCRLPLLGKEKMDIDLFALLKGKNASKEFMAVLRSGSYIE
jgi:predicted RNA-binding Zn-ribbon protein involved in translation (DUF1610 family)